MQDGVPERPLDPAAVKTAEKSLLTPRNERRMKELLVRQGVLDAAHMRTSAAR